MDKVRRARKSTCAWRAGGYPPVNISEHDPPPQKKDEAALHKAVAEMPAEEQKYLPGAALQAWFGLFPGVPSCLI